ncbi:MAG: hypothetical protein CMH83_23515 [Nocardioides sp.]|nr:hypothetical protein [Nocardioides sp.]
MDPMRFTEREMTVGVEAVARHVHALGRAPWRRRSADEAWDGLGRGQRYPLLAAAGEVVLPVLVALPERPTVGAVPEFSEEEYAAAAAQAQGDRDTGQGARGLGDTVPTHGRQGRRPRVDAAALARVAVESMPPRQDPDALVVPDHL